MTNGDYRRRMEIIADGWLLTEIIGDGWLLKELNWRWFALNRAYQRRFALKNLGFFCSYRQAFFFYGMK